MPPPPAQPLPIMEEGAGNLLYRRQVVPTVPPPPTNTGSQPLVIILVVTIGSILVIAVVSYFVWRYYKNAKSEQDDDKRWELKGKYPMTDRDVVTVVMPTATHHGDYPRPEESGRAIGKIYQENLMREQQELQQQMNYMHAGNEHNNNHDDSDLDDLEDDYAQDIETGHSLYNKLNTKGSIRSNLKRGRSRNTKNNKTTTGSSSSSWRLTKRLDALPEPDSSSLHSHSSSTNNNRDQHPGAHPYQRPGSNNRSRSHSNSSSRQSMAPQKLIPGASSTFNNTNNNNNGVVLHELPPRFAGGPSTWTPPTPPGARLVVHVAYDPESHGTPPATPSMSSEASIRTLITRPHDPFEEGELSLSPGDIVVVNEWREDGWCYGRVAYHASNNNSNNRRGGKKQQQSAPRTSRSNSSLRGSLRTSRSRDREPVASVEADSTTAQNTLTREGPVVVAVGWFPMACLVTADNYLVREKLEDIDADQARLWAKEVAKSGGIHHIQA